jgi:hypothetical protein
MSQIVTDPITIKIGLSALLFVASAFGIGRAALGYEG